MKYFIQYLKRHKNKYSCATTTDFIKLIYQSELAGGHMIKSKDTSHNYLLNEIKEIIPNNEIELYEYISSNIVRINLEPYVYYNHDINLLNDLFFNSSNLHYDGNNILSKTNLLNELGINDDIVNQFKNNPKAYHHSDIYRIKYNPHYRVINTTILPLELRINKLQQFIDKLDKSKLNIVALEGKCTSGKSTITNMLHNVTIIHADDFFSKTDVLDFKLLTELIEKLKINESIEYKAYCCQNDSYYTKTINNVMPVVIIEGVYSYSKILRKYYNYLVYTEVTIDDQVNRLRKRNLSKYLYDKFINEWIPRENKYFDDNNYIEIADIII